jgi:hypothetical protein
VRGKLWIESFVKVMIDRGDKGDGSTRASWTQEMGHIMDKVGKELGCAVVRRRPDVLDKNESGEYLNIDFMFFNIKDYDEGKRILPKVAVEHENNRNKKKIEYCLWKILCIRSPIRVLICYQSNADKVTKLRQHLEDVIWQGSLMKGSIEDLFVIIGDESVANKDEWDWRDYFKVFEWRSDTLKRVEGIEW